ncbi:hypothetical protein BFJ71_g14729 [Fusarium oxysporum]|nr:hypothetical protein BFJ71_g14729 [Fusarium oxysporum]
MVPRYFLSTLAWLKMLGVAAGNRLLPPADSFEGQGDLPSFSLKLGNDTASVCNSTTPGTAGFIKSDDGTDSEMFFWLYESKNDPSTDPVILWMSGGPGASSTAYGGLMELGPCRIAHEGGYTVDNPFGWNTNASVIFVDQPVSVGFSRGNAIPDGLVDASHLMHRFLRQFFTAFPQLSHQDFYISGESYGGSWVPALGAIIAKSQAEGDKSGYSVNQQSKPSQNQLSEPAGAVKINLKGVMVGNGLIRRSVQNGGGFETACSGPDSLFNSSTCRKWAPRAMWCEQNLGVCETEGWTSDVCRKTEKLCSEMGQYVTGTLRRNPYDFRLPCENELECYAEMPLIDEYFNRTDVKTALGVEPNAPFRGVSLEVFNRWQENGDLWKSSDSYVNYLLNANYRVLIYVGDKDWYCNAAGMRRLVDQGLVWHGHPFFRFRELIPWYTGLKPAGRWKAYGPLTYAEIVDAGHLAPFDKPEETLTLINSWIQGSLPSH